MTTEEDPFSVEEVERDLLNIERKYSPMSSRSNLNASQESLLVLSQEFDSVGLPSLNLQQSYPNIFKQVVCNARSLIHIHRNTVSKVSEVNMEKQHDHAKNYELQKKLENYQTEISKMEDKCSALQNKIIRLENTNEYLAKKEEDFKTELTKTKKYYLSNQNKLQHNIEKLRKEYQLLKERCKEDIKCESTTDTTLKLLKKYKDNEAVYERTIQKLQQNFQSLVEEVLDLKEELLLMKDNGTE